MLSYSIHGYVFIWNNINTSDIYIHIGDKEVMKVKLHKATRVLGNFVRSLRSKYHRFSVGCLTRNIGLRSFLVDKLKTKSFILVNGMNEIGLYSSIIISSFDRYERSNGPYL